MTPQNRRIFAELVKRVTEAAVLATAARRQVADLEPGALYLHPATASFDVEWVVLARKEGVGLPVLVVAADALTMKGRFDVSVDPTEACGALSLRCAVGVWIPARVLRSEHRSGSLPSRAVERARAMCREIQRAQSNSRQIDPVDGILVPDWDPDAYGERLQQLAMASRLLEAQASARPVTISAFEEREAEDEISTLYETIARRAETLDPAMAANDPELSRAWAALRRLQSEEADRYQEAFESSLAMPIDAGKTLLERARALRQRFENPATDHPAAYRTHRT